jgi:hypothetical protein
LQLEGLAYRLMPIDNPGASDGVVNTTVMYDNMMTKMFWRNLDNPNVYYDENYKRFPLNSRKSFYMLASQLLNEAAMEGDTSKSLVSQAEGGLSNRQKAKAVLDYCFKVMPDKGTRYDVYTPQFIPLLLEIGNKKLADEIATVMHRRAMEDLAYQTKNPKKVNNFDIQTNVYILQQLYMAYRAASGESAKAAQYQKDFETYEPYTRMGEQEGGYEEE